MEIVRESLPVASMGTYLCTHIRLTVPSLPAIWSVSDGRLPPGLRLDAHSGRLYGVPIQAGVWCCGLHAQLGTHSALAPLAMVVSPASAPFRVQPAFSRGLLAEIRMRYPRSATATVPAPIRISPGPGAS